MEFLKQWSLVSKNPQWGGDWKLYVEEVQLIDLAADTRREEQDITLQPGDGTVWEFESSAGATHAGGGSRR